MNVAAKSAWKAVLLLGLLIMSLPALADDDDDAPARIGSVSELPALTPAQQQAAGVATAKTTTISPSMRIDAYCSVLDPSALAADLARLDGLRAEAQAADAEFTRLQRLSHSAAGAAQKNIDAARASRAQTRAAVAAAEASLNLQWGPLARLPAAKREALVAAVGDGRERLLRADLPGRDTVPSLPARALVDIDGAQVEARVLGSLPKAAPVLHSTSLLLVMPHPPAGLGVGARLTATLEGAPVSGRVVPASALLYGDNGAYVYRELPQKKADGATEFAPLPVQPLQRLGDGWLVRGIDGNDAIVVHGAGVLWSLQGVGLIGEDDDD